MLTRDDLNYFINAQVNGTKTHVVKHILVADDNHANRLIAKSILERDGYKVSLAVNGQDAVNSVKTQMFDIILMDILMPVMDGIKALRRIQSLAPSIKTPPIFAITAFCSPADQHRYRVAGFDAVLTKPLRHGDIELALKQFSSGMATTPVKDLADNTYNFETIDMLDAAIINQLRMAADVNALQNIQQKFWADVQSQSQTIKIALPAALNAMPSGLREMRKSVHAIKGASASIGLLRASHIARHLQNAPPSQIGGLLNALFETLIMSKLPLSTALLEHISPNQNCAAALQNGANARTG